MKVGEKKQSEEVKEKNVVEKDVGKKEARGGGFSLKVLLVNILVSLMVAIGVVYVYDKYYAQKIVAFDLKGYIIGLRDMYLAGKINDEDLKKAIDMAYDVIKSQKKNKVVIMGDVILSPVEVIDYPVRVEFPSFLFNMNGTLGKEGGRNDGRGR
jgi:archaellum component FlaF (FlaF/FlaG flagellin family)